MKFPTDDGLPRHLRAGANAFREVGSDAVLERVSQESELWISRWTTAEFCSAAAFKIRRGDCDLVAANRSVQKMFEMVKSKALQRADVITKDLETAGTLCLAYESGLRIARVDLTESSFLGKTPQIQRFPKSKPCWTGIRTSSC